MTQKIDRSLKLISFLLPALAGTVFLGCNSSGADSGAPANVSTPQMTAAVAAAPAAPGAPAAGESCVSSDPNKLCLAIQFIVYKNSAGVPTATPEQAATIVHTMNQLFASCNLGFQIETFESVDPAAKNLAYGAEAQNQLDQVRQAFMDSSRMLAVTTGPWDTATNAWTTMPGDTIHGAVMESGVVTYGSGIIYAHEFGHYLGLDHVSDSSDLMNPVIYQSSTKIESGQCQTARETATTYWASMLRK